MVVKINSLMFLKHSDNTVRSTMDKHKRKLVMFEKGLNDRQEVKPGTTQCIMRIKRNTE